MPIDKLWFSPEYFYALKLGFASVISLLPPSPPIPFLLSPSLPLQGLLMRQLQGWGVHCNFGLHLVWRAWPLSYSPASLCAASSWVRFPEDSWNWVVSQGSKTKLLGDYLHLCLPGSCWVTEILLGVYNKHNLEWERRHVYISLWNSLSDAWYMSSANSSGVYSFVQVFDLLLLEQWMSVGGCMERNVNQRSQWKLRGGNRGFLTKQNYTKNA